MLKFARVSFIVHITRNQNQKLLRQTLTDLKLFVTDIEVLKRLYKLETIIVVENLTGIN